MKQPAPASGTAESLRRVDRAMRRVPVEPLMAAESARYESLLVNAPIALYRVDRAGKLLDGNPALVRMLGRSSLEELLAENGSGPFSTRGRARFWFRLQREGVVNGFESEWARLDGRRVYLREHARAVRGPDGAVTSFEGTLEDISDRRAAEKQIQKERDFSSAVIDTAGSPVVILDREGKVVRFNQACEALSGYSFHDVAEKPIWEVLCPPEVRTECRTYFQKLLGGDFPSTHESRWLTRGGEVRQIAWSDTALLDENDGVRNIISMGIDITERKVAEKALRESETRYRELFESASDVVFRMAPDGTLLSINAAASKLTGYTTDQVPNVYQILEPEELAFAKSKLAAKLQHGGDTQYEVKIRTASGTYVYVDLKTTLRFKDGKPCEVLGIARDITWRKRAEEFERGRRTILEMAARHEPLPDVMETLARLVEAQFPGSSCSIHVEPVDDLSGMSEFASGGAQPAIQGVADSKGIAPRAGEPDSGKGVSKIAAPGMPGVPRFCSLEATDPEYALGHRMRWEVPVPSRQNGQLAVIHLLVKTDEPPTSAESDILASNVRLATLTIEHRLMTDRIQWNAQHDRLTGLGNRELFEECLRSAISRSSDGSRPLAIYLVDLDRFKLINDTLGHETGDLLIKAVAERLSDKVGQRGLLARMGADEFMVMVNPVWSREQAQVMAQELIACFETPFDADGQELFISASIGCSMFPWDGEDVATLRQNADTAMYRAKGSGRNRFVQFAPAMTAGLARRLKVQNELHRALERGELELYYQPQHDLENDRMIGAEALLRWTSRNLGPVSPQEFIPVAEESGLIVAIGTWVIREACRQCRDWCDAGHPLRIAVNVSAWQFARPDFVDTVEQALKSSGIPAHLLELELTESVLMREAGETNICLDRLREMGVLVSIDDFGTGYSSLAYLQRLPIQSLKIDLSFVRAIPKSEEVPPLIRAITALAQGLNIGVLAEGVEQQYQARVLRRAGCNRVQGYLYGRPTPAGELSRLLGTDCRPSRLMHE